MVMMVMHYNIKWLFPCQQGPQQVRAESRNGCRRFTPTCLILYADIQDFLQSNISILYIEPLMASQLSGYL